MSAYQNNQNGLLATFFNQRIKQKTDVTSVMQNVLEGNIVISYITLVLIVSSHEARFVFGQR